MRIAVVGTVLFMLLAVPLIVPGRSADEWSVAKPLITLLFLPMDIGMAVRATDPSFAGRYNGGLHVLVIYIIGFTALFIYGANIQSPRWWERG